MGVAQIAAWVQERHDQLHMRRWMLEFDQRDVEREFRAVDDLAGIRQAPFALTIAVFFIAVYGAVDAVVLTDEPATLVLRFAIVLPTVVVSAVMLLTVPVVRRHLQLNSVLLMAFLILTLGTVMAAVTDLPPEYVRTSMTVTLIGAIGLLRLRMHAAVAGVTIYGVASLTLPGVQADVDTYLSSHLAPTVGLSTIAVIVAYALERLRRTDFLRQREVEMELRRSDDLLYNMLPVPIADRLRTERGAIAESADEVSVLFSDIVGFTPLSQSLPAERVVALLDAMFSEFDRLCEQRGIEKIKTVGDAYMAVSGLPVPNRDHAASLAELALDMQRASTRLSDDWPTPIALRIGIASGPVVAGVIGQRKFAYDLWGDTVNTASRMESHGRPHRVQVSESTYRLLEHRYVFSEPQQVEVKGKGAMTTYFLLGAPA
ncbi:hypothetical protein E9934_17705 [Nocardioides caeni]|uniref:Adenylate cyclase n=1 Tax=Nocardioides caeni TaxID=574700 RepID=A0A4S8N076_9ACTN|nr:adenylate/guanylate cyclase domain-containing protein [Nocardioides caeni]THV09025.1 hypothetical protein E9934_17705 [Nocardioides caeni]